MRRKIVRFFEYLGHYEKELYLDAPPPVEAVKVVQPKTTPPLERGLNPYPQASPHPSLEHLEAAIKGCLKCPLGTSRTKFVFGTGSKNARIVFIGEAPGRQEDLQGIPFVGRAGELLNSMLQQIGWQRHEVYICNILKCRPPNNRDPQPEEISQCEPYLHEQLRLLDPEWLVALGRIAAQVLLGTTAPVKALRGRVHKYRGKPFWVTYHPAALLRNQNYIPDATQDLNTLKKMFESKSGVE
ncbi:MAG: uracil-DNA glycosylase [bacterium]